jgi:AP endonuclease-1
MARRSAWKTEEAEVDFETVETTVTPKKGRKVKIETTEIVAKTITSKSAKKEIKTDSESDGDTAEASKKPSSKRGAKKVKAEVDLEEDTAAKPKKASVKRKTKIDDDNEEDDEKEQPPLELKKASAKRKAKEDEGDGEEDGKGKTKKKRKTKEEKEAEAMPLAVRTAIGSLKKAIYIGAHVSAAGGMNIRKSP